MMRVVAFYAAGAPLVALFFFAIVLPMARAWQHIGAAFGGLH